MKTTYITNGHYIERIEHPKRVNDPEYMGDRSFKWSIYYNSKQIIFRKLSTAKAWCSENPTGRPV